MAESWSRDELNSWLFALAPQVYDEDGNDVTPAPLVQIDNALAKGPSKGSVGGDQSADGTQTVSISTWSHDIGLSPSKSLFVSVVQ